MERALRVLDGAVLVVSAVEGVQAQTRVLMRALRRLGIPTLIFVNKIDRPGAGDERVLRGVAGKLSPAVAPAWRSSCPPPPATPRGPWPATSSNTLIAVTLPASTAIARKEVIGATLAEEFGVDVTFSETTTICVERVAGTGTAVEIIDTPSNPILATVGLRIEPGPAGALTRGEGLLESAFDRYEPVRGEVPTAAAPRP